MMSPHQKGKLAESIAQTFFISKGWEVRPHSGRGPDFYVSDGWGKPLVIEVKSLRVHGGKHVAANGFVMEGHRPEVSLSLTNNRGMYYRDTVDWLIGVDVWSEECYSYSKEALQQMGGKKSIRVTHYPCQEFPEAPSTVQERVRAERPQPGKIR